MFRFHFAFPSEPLCCTHNVSACSQICFAPIQNCFCYFRFTATYTNWPLSLHFGCCCCTTRKTSFLQISAACAWTAMTKFHQHIDFNLKLTNHVMGEGQKENTWYSMLQQSCWSVKSISSIKKQYQKYKVKYNELEETQEHAHSVNRERETHTHPHIINVSS